MRTRGHVTATRLTTVITVLVLAVSACGDGSSGTRATGDPVATSTAGASGSTTAPAGGTTDTTGSVDTTTSTPAEYDPFAFISGFELADPPSPIPGSEVGQLDAALAAAITGDLAAAGVDLTGVEVWVFEVAAAGQRLLVFEVDQTAEGLTEDPTGGDMFTILAGAPSLPDPASTQFVLNYRDSDSQGDFILTMTLPLGALLDSINSGADVSEFASIQVVRDGVAQ